MKGSTGRANSNSNSSASSRTQQALQSSLHAQPFVPDSRALTSSPIPAIGSKATKLSLANVNAAPFVPGSAQQEQRRPSNMQGFVQGGRGRGYLGNSQGAAWALPDGDDLLGLSAHTPGQTLQPPATPVQDGRLDRAAADTATTQAAPYSPARSYTSTYQEQAGGARGRGRGRQPVTSSPARAAPSPDKGSPAYGRGQGRAIPLRRGQAQQMQLQFMRDQLRQELQQRSFLSHAQAERRPEEFGLPEMVQQYHSLVPLEDLQAAADQPSSAFGVCTMLLRAAASQLQGQAVTLRRLDPRQDLRNLSLILLVWDTQLMRANRTGTLQFTTLLRLLRLLPQLVHHLRQPAGPSQALLTSGQEAVDMWRCVAHHPGLVCPRAAFVSDKVGSRPALYFVHDHMPGAVTLEQAHMQPQAGPAGLQRAPAAEQQLWTYLTQLAMALRALHTAGLAVGSAGLAATKVLLTSRATARIKLGSIGVVHVLKGMRGRREDMAVQQQEDIAAVGSLMVRLAGAAAGGPALQALAGHLSPHLMHLLASLQNSHIRDCHMPAAGRLRASNSTDNMQSHQLAQPFHLEQLCSAVHEHSLEILEGQMMQQDALMSQLAQELDNGRLLRLLSRLVAVSEGSQTSLEPNWSETGDRYLIKLFKDFVFHQVNEAGVPLLDWGHVVEALNKLDLGVNEKIMLLSRDEMSMLLVSYADVKQCINTTFKELEMRASQRHD